jgi:high-affinity Fe2+/Pb2+ permease
LSEELKAGEVETTPLIALSSIGIWLGLFIAIVIALVFVVGLSPLMATPE